MYLSLTAAAMAAMAAFLVALTSAPALVPVVPPHPGRLGIVYVTGDTGVHFGMSAPIVRRLAARGYPAVMVDSLVAFRRPESDADAAALIADAADLLRRVSGCTRVVIIGHSFGADLLVHVIDDLPPRLMKRTAGLAFVVPSRQTYSRVSPMRVLGLEPPERVLVASDLPAHGVPMLCIAGAREDESLCPVFAPGSARIVRVAGGHRLAHDAGPAAAAIASWLRTLSGHHSDG